MEKPKSSVHMDREVYRPANLECCCKGRYKPRRDVACIDECIIDNSPINSRYNNKAVYIQKPTSTVSTEHVRSIKLRPVVLVCDDHSREAYTNDDDDVWYKESKTTSSTGTVRLAMRHPRDYAMTNVDTIDTMESIEMRKKSNESSACTSELYDDRLELMAFAISMFRSPSRSSSFMASKMYATSRLCSSGSVLYNRPLASVYKYKGSDNWARGSLSPAASPNGVRGVESKLFSEASAYIDYDRIVSSDDYTSDFGKEYDDCGSRHVESKYNDGASYHYGRRFDNDDFIDECTMHECMKHERMQGERHQYNRFRADYVDMQRFDRMTHDDRRSQVVYP